jgi:hypothetical protein
MENSVLFFGAYGLIFFLGFALVLRPVVILTSLIFRPGFLALSVLLALGARAALMSAPAETAPIMAASIMALIGGAAVGFPLRFLIRGGF